MAENKDILAVITRTINLGEALTRPTPAPASKAQSERPAPAFKAAPAPSAFEIARKAVKEAVTAIEAAQKLGDDAAIAAATTAFRAACSATWYAPRALMAYMIDRFLDAKGVLALSRKHGGREVVMVGDAARPRRLSAVERRLRTEAYLARKREELAAATTAATATLQAAAALKTEKAAALAAAMVVYREARQKERAARLEAGKRREEAKAKRREARKAEKEVEGAARREKKEEVSSRLGRGQTRTLPVTRVTSSTVFFGGRLRASLSALATRPRVGDTMTLVGLGGVWVAPIDLQRTVVGVENTDEEIAASRQDDAKENARRIKASLAVVTDDQARGSWAAYRRKVEAENNRTNLAFRPNCAATKAPAPKAEAKACPLQANLGNMHNCW